MKIIKSLSLFLFLFLLNFSFSFAGNIDKKWAWSENFGWVNFNPTHGNVEVFNDKLTGNFWIENAGWVNLNPENGGVLNKYGILSGEAWSENIGWIDFSSVNINPNTGLFSGTATTERFGRINFTGDNISVITSWRGADINLNGENEKRFRGYAWSDNIGWISMNCSNTSSCNYIDYGVDIDNTGKISGLAWSDNAGWLDFSYYNNAKLNMTTGELSGDIQFLAALGEDDNWKGKVSLSSSSPQYGPILDFDTYEYDGFAWGSDVIGWIDFKTSYSSVTLDPFRFLFTANKGLSTRDPAPYHSSVVLSWITDGASSCIASDGGSTNWASEPNKSVGEPVAATFTIVDLKVNTKFILTCKDSSDKEIKRELIIIAKAAAPNVTITASDTNIPYNTPANLNWIAEKVSSCVASGDWSGTKSIGTQTELTGNLTEPVNVFFLECISDFTADYPDPVSDSIQVNVAKLSVDLYAEQNTIPYGGRIKVFWEVEFANSCVASGDLAGFSGAVDSSDGKHVFEIGSFEIEEGTIYSATLTCQGSRSQTETKKIELRVGRNPIYKEN